MNRALIVVLVVATLLGIGIVRGGDPVGAKSGETTEDAASLLAENKITIDVTDASLHRVLDEISQQAEFPVAVTSSLLSQMEVTVTLRLRGVSPHDALRICLGPIDGHVTVRQIDNMFLIDRMTPSEILAKIQRRELELEMKSFIFPGSALDHPIFGPPREELGK